MCIQYDYFQGVLGGLFEWCGNHVLELNDEELIGVIYEEYMYCSTDLYEDNIKSFLQLGFITDEIAEKMRQIYKLSNEMLSDGQERSAHIIRNSPTWKKIFDLTDEIKAKIKLYF